MRKRTLSPSLLSAATLGTLATSSASAAIVYFDADDLTALHSKDTIYFDLLSGSATLGTMTQNPTPEGFALVKYDAIEGNDYSVTLLFQKDGQAVGDSTEIAAFAKQLQFGEVVGAGTLSWVEKYYSNVRRNTSGYESGNWSAGTGGYLGLRVGDATNGYNYGWADVSIGADHSLTLHSFAVETEKNVAIQAGAIPEPSTYAAIAGLLAGSAALYARRRQRAA